MKNNAQATNKNFPQDSHERHGHKIKNVLHIVLTVIFVLLLVCGGILIFHNVYFTPFYVNGQSMYPTFNEFAVDQNGEYVGATGHASYEGYVVEFGIMDTTENAKKNIKRENVIITYYKDDYGNDGQLLSSASCKIKRVVGLPGERIAMDCDGNILINGVLIVLNTVPHYTLSKDRTMGEIQLANDEYFVLGDNRDNSRDSRSAGPIKFSYIEGVAKAIEGTCKISYKNGKQTCENKTYKWPRVL